ncbi:MAG: AgmX/PglI C-terminal domain-containing protein [Myxococcales bacterium]|nr:AgmX/PglI C-terminal domain-containing protein [Myxococcales bacterium]MCB9525929.1 AgmX/PglI C-terminal domain-containing protein [Myxococcales bacterium]
MRLPRPLPLAALALSLLSSPALATPSPAPDAALLQLARSVKTSPGRLPTLTVKGAQVGLPLEHTRVHAELATHVARVDVTQTFVNDHDAPIEAVYVFPLPENSAVDDMIITVGDRTIRAQIKERKAARLTYEAAKQAGHTAALLEQERPNIFTQSVANLPPGERIEVHLRYVQTLTYDVGEYEFVFPMVVGPRFSPGTPTGKQGDGWALDTDQVPDASRLGPPIMGVGERTGHDIDLEVVLDPGLPLIDLQTPTHKTDAWSEASGLMHVSLAEDDRIPNRDFMLRYRLDGDAPQAATHVFRKAGAPEGHFMVVLQPPTLDVDHLVGQRELLFVVDVSGSMSGAPLAQAKAALRLALQGLRPVDTFNVITFAGQTARLWDRPRPANDTHLAHALRFLDGVTAGGGTHMADAVEQALAPQVEPGRHRYVFFLTDGYVGNEAALFDGARGLVRGLKAKGQRARVFTLGVGSSTNRHLLDGLAKAGDGLASYVTLRETPHRAINRMYRLIDHSVLREVRIDWGDLPVRDVEPAELPDLFASRPLVIHGRYVGQSAGEATLTAIGPNGRPVTLTIPLDLPLASNRAPAAPTLWARQRVATLSQRLWRGHDAEAVKAITAVGLKHRIVTAYTSFVAVDDSRKVGDGRPAKVIQAAEAPEGVDPAMAGGAMLGKSTGARGTLAVMGSAGDVGGLSNMFGDAVGEVQGFGGLGTIGAGRGGGGLGSGGGYGRGAVLGRRTRAPRISNAVPQVMGSLDGHAVHRVLRKHANQFRYAYEKQLRANPTFKGRWELVITIGPDGKVAAVQLADEAQAKTDFGKALLRIAKRLRFPKPAGGGKVVVRYPLVFTPGN